MFTEKRPRGRPPGPTEQGLETRERLFAAALVLFEERGYAQATLRELARRAEVSPGLLYAYFPSKLAIVLELYDRLSAAFVERAEGDRGGGGWFDRSVAVLAHSLAVLRPHREALRALAPVIALDPEAGQLAPGSAVSRSRVEGAFVRAVAEAPDAPAVAEPLARLLYRAHLLVILFWLADRSPGQRATERLVAWGARVGRWAAPWVGLPPVAAAVRELEGIVAEGG